MKNLKKMMKKCKILLLLAITTVLLSFQQQSTQVESILIANEMTTQTYNRVMVKYGVEVSRSKKAEIRAQYVSVFGTFNVVQCTMLSNEFELWVFDSPYTPVVPDDTRTDHPNSDDLLPHEGDGFEFIWGSNTFLCNGN